MIRYSTSGHMHTLSHSHSFSSKYLWNTYHVLGIVVNANDVIANKMNNIPYLQHSRRVHTRSNQGNFWNGKDILSSFQSWWTIEDSIFYSFVVYLTEKAMAPHPSTLAWKIPRMEEPGRLQSTGSQRVRHDWETSLSFTFSLGLSIKGLPSSTPHCQHTQNCHPGDPLYLKTLAH